MTDRTDDGADIIEDFELLLELRRAYSAGDRASFDGIVREIGDELDAEFHAQVQDKIMRWATATKVQRFLDRAPPRSYIQAKLLYRDGFYDATILVCRSIAEMICYDRLDGMQHPFGTREQVERKNFRELAKWLGQNDPLMRPPVVDRLNDLYTLGNNYVHPKAGHDAKTDSLKALDLIGQSVIDIYGVKSISDMIGKKVRSAYTAMPDVATGQNFILTAFATPKAANAHARRHHAPAKRRKPERKRRG